MTDGEPQSNGPGEEERVRFCLGCGAVLPFEAVACPACGHDEPSHPDSPGERVVACPACLEFMAASLLFCPACGVEIATVGHGQPFGAEPAPEAVAGAIPAVCAALALAAPLLALFALGELVLDALPGLLP